MKTARFLLACAAASVLAACGSDTITAPAAAPARAHADGSTSGTSSTGCVTTLVMNPDGTYSVQCVYDSNGQLGTGY